MARYYFDILHDDGCLRDDVGVELPDADAMRSAVSRILMDLGRDEIDDEPQAKLQVAVRDDSDFVLFTATLDYSTRWH